MSTDAQAGMQQALGTAVRRLRRALVAALVIGVAGLVGLTLAGEFVAGVMLCVGLGLGAANTRLVQRSLSAFAGQNEPKKSTLMFSVLRRLTVITAVALAIAFVYQPDGWTVLLGLALFQLVVMGSVFGGLFKEVRRA